VVLALRPLNCRGGGHRRWVQCLILWFHVNLQLSDNIATVLHPVPMLSGIQKERILLEITLEKVFLGHKWVVFLVVLEVGVLGHV
jgi:hypothetical protein